MTDHSIEAAVQALDHEEVASVERHYAAPEASPASERGDLLREHPPESMAAWLEIAKQRHFALLMAIDDGDDYGEHVGLQRHRRAIYDGQAEILELWEKAVALRGADRK